MSLISPKVLPSALSPNGQPTITAIDFEIGDDGAIALAYALRNNKEVHRIYLLYSDVGDEGACAMAESVKSRR